MSSTYSFPIGWYSDSDPEYMKVLLGITPNKYGFTDPFNNYYNIFMNYSIYNRIHDYSSVCLSDYIPFLKMDSSLIKDKKFIVDLPNHSALYRPLFNFKKSISFPDTYLFNTYSVSNGKKVPLNVASMKKNIKATASEDLPVFSIISSSLHQSDSGYTLFDFKENLVFDSVSNAVVYKYADVIGFAYRKTSINGGFAVKFGITVGEITENIVILSDSSEFSLFRSNLPALKDSISLIFSIDGFVFKPLKKQIKIEDLNKDGILISSPSNLNVPDTIWKIFEIDLKRLAGEIFGLKITAFNDICIYLNGYEIGDFLFSYNKKHMLENVKAIVDRFPDYASENILGFYTSDEIEHQEVVHLDRWQNHQLYYKNSHDKTLKTDSFRLYSVQETIRKYIQKKGYIPFTLSTIYSYHRRNLDLTNLPKIAEYPLFTDSVIFFDDYTYQTEFIDLFQKARNLADSLSCSIFFVNDAYSAKGHPARDFVRMRWKFFAPIIMGADGMLFYSYFSPKIKSFSEFLSDTNKMTVGYLSKYITETGIRNSLLYSDEFTINISDGNSRISSVSSDSSGNIFFMYFIEKGPATMSLNKSVFQFEFFSDDDDIMRISRLIGGRDYFMNDITPLSFSNCIPEENCCIEDSTGIIVGKDVVAILNSSGINKTFCDYDIKIIHFKPYNR